MRPPYSLSAFLGRLRLGRVVASVLRPCFVASFPFGLRSLGARCGRCEAFAFVPLGVFSPCFLLPGVVGPLCLCLACLVFVGSPAALFASLPPAVRPVWCPGPVLTLVPPSGYLVASVTAWLPCYLLGVWQCFVVLTSLCLMAAKASGPVWGVLHPLHHVASAVRPLSFTTLRYSSF